MRWLNRSNFAGKKSAIIIMSSLLTSKLRFLIPASFGASLSLYIGFRLFSRTAYNDAPSKALKGFGRWQKFRIVNIEQISHDTRKFTFELPDAGSVLGLKPTSFVLTNVPNKWGPWNIRPYTPISRAEERGKFQIVVKHIPGGKISGQFFHLKEDDSVAFMGPMPKYGWKPNKFDEIDLLCGGSGITPMFQLMRHIAEDRSDKTKIKLFYANKTENDIILRRELEELKQQFPEKVSLQYYVEKGPAGSGIKKGHIPKEDIADSDAAKRKMIFLCGPDGFINAYAGPKGIFGLQYSVGGILGDLGYDSSQVFRF